MVNSNIQEQNSRKVLLLLILRRSHILDLMSPEELLPAVHKPGEDEHRLAEIGGITVQNSFKCTA